MLGPSSSSSSSVRLLLPFFQLLLPLLLLTTPPSAQGQSLRSRRRAQQQPRKVVGGTPATITTVHNNNNATAARIVGGRPVGLARSKYPWYAITRTGALCGAALVAPDLLVTAGHCRTHFRRAGVFLGAAALLPSGDGAVEEWEVDGEYVHPDYNATTLESDLMLVRLKTSGGQEGGSKIDPVEINGDDYVPANREEVTAIGFGATREGGPLSPALREVRLEVTPHRVCARNYARLKGDGDGDEEQHVVRKRVMLCAGGTGRDACQVRAALFWLLRNLNLRSRRSGTFCLTCLPPHFLHNNRATAAGR